MGEPEFLWVDDDVATQLKDPKIQRARNQLRASPGRWALLVESEGIFSQGWWRPLEDDDHYELSVGSVGQGQFGRKVYGRYVGFGVFHCKICGKLMMAESAEEGEQYTLADELYCSIQCVDEDRNANPS